MVEDCGVTEKELEELFNKPVAQIVMGLTKISKINFKTQVESKVENYRKMIVAMSKDIRVIIVKLADRMHNMRTLEYVSGEKRNKKARETLDIYVPLAGRMGIHSIKAELEDLCLRYLHPDVHNKLSDRLNKAQFRKEYIKKTIVEIQNYLDKHIKNSIVKGRFKHNYSIYKKMVEYGVEFDQIQDILAFRIIVDNITECYKTLGIIHSCYKPIPGRFKDYIAIPKVNGYQSLHSSIVGLGGQRIEIQIRTHEMDEIAETGLAAHWKYKEGVAAKNSRLDWTKKLLDMSQSILNNTDFIDAVKEDLDVGEIFVFTPKGDVYELGAGSTPLDFCFFGSY